MSDFEKAKKNLKNDMIALFVLEIIGFALSIGIDKINYFSLVFAILLLVGFLLAKNGSKAAGIVGIVTGILMMFTIILGNIIPFLLGLFVLIHSLKYNKLYK